MEPAGGIRAIACLGTLTGHTMFWLAGSGPDKLMVYRFLNTYPWASLVMKMPQVFMDTFFVLTGFWAAHSLIETLPRASNKLLVVLKYYYGRLAKIIPNMYSMLIFVYFCVLPATRSPFLSDDARRAFVDVDPFNQANCPRLLWATFSFVNNFMPYAGCVSYTWSMAVQMQFYLILPPILLLCNPSMPAFKSMGSDVLAAVGLILWRKYSGTRSVARRTLGRVAAFIIFWSLMHRLYIMIRVRLWEMIPIPFYGPYPGDTEIRMHYMWSASYLSLISHATPLSLGLLTHIALNSVAVNTAISRHNRKLTALTSAVAMMVVLDLRTSIYGPIPDPHHPAANPLLLALAFVIHNGLLQPLLPCMILLLACHGRTKGYMNLFARAMSAKWLSTLASMSFDIYLLHPIVIMGVWSVYPPSGWLESPNALSFLILSAVILLLTICVARLHAQLVSSLVFLLGALVQGLSRKSSMFWKGNTL